MGLLLFLLWLVVIVYGAFLFLRRLFLRSAFYRQNKIFFDMMRQGADASGRTRSGAPRQHGASSAAGQPRPPRGKVFHPGEGEYVEFEEIEVTASTFTELRPDEPPAPRRSRRQREAADPSKVTDADWEDLPGEE